MQPPRRVRVVDDNASTIYDLPLPYYEDVYPQRSKEKEEAIDRTYDRCAEESSDDDFDSLKGKKKRREGGIVQHVRFFSPVGLVKQAGEVVNVKGKGRKEGGIGIFAEFATPKTNNTNTATSGVPSSRAINEPNAKRKLLTPKKFEMFASPPALSPPPPVSSPAAPEMNTAAEVMDDLLSGRPSVDAEERVEVGTDGNSHENGDQTGTIRTSEGEDHVMTATPVQAEVEKASDADVEDNGDRTPIKNAAGKKRKRDMQTVDASKIRSHQTRGQERREMEKIEAVKKAARPAKRVKTGVMKMRGKRGEEEGQKKTGRMGRSKCGKAGGRVGRKEGVVEVFEDETDSEQYVRWK